MDRRPNIWVKVTGPERLTKTGPPYDDVVPFARAITERFPDRVLWGTDWPHPNMTTHMPDDGVLTDMIPKFAPTAERSSASCWSTIRCGSIGATDVRPHAAL